MRDRKTQECVTNDAWYVPWKNLKILKVTKIQNALYSHSMGKNRKPKLSIKLLHGHYRFSFLSILWVCQVGCGESNSGLQN